MPFFRKSIVFYNVIPIFIKKTIMKTYLKISALVLFVILSVSCSIVGEVGNGIIKSADREISKDFSAIHVSEGIKVYLTQSSEHKLSVELDENLHELLMTEVNDQVLKIYFKENVRVKHACKVYLSHDVINELKSSSAASIHSETIIKSENMSISSSSGSSMVLKIDAVSVSCNSSSGSNIKIKGICDNLNADSSSGSHIKAKGLESKTAVVESSSGSSLSIFASEKIDASASSGSNIKISGNPQSKNIETSSGGNIRFNE